MVYCIDSVLDLEAVYTLMRVLLHDCTTGCGTDGSICGTIPESLHDPGGAPVLHEVRVPEVGLAMVQVSGASLPPLSLYLHLASPLHKVVTILKSK